MKSGSPSRTTAAHKKQTKIQAWSSLVFHCRHSSFNPSEAPPWDSRPVSGAGVVHYQLLHRPCSVPTALGPAPLVTDGMPHGRARSSSAKLPEFLQKQECGTTETVSEAPGAYGIRSCSHAAWVASYETTSALAILPSPEVGMAPRYTSSKHHSQCRRSLGPWMDLAFLQAGVPL